MSARFCPACGTAVADFGAERVTVPTAVNRPDAPGTDTRDAAEALLTVRTVEGIEEQEDGTPAEEALFRRVREDAARRRSIRRRVAVAGLAALILIAAVVWAQRAGRAPELASAPAPAEAPPSTTSSEPPRAAAPEPDASASAPAATGRVAAAPTVSEPAAPAPAPPAPAPKAAPAPPARSTATPSRPERVAADRSDDTSTTAPRVTSRRSEPAPLQREPVDLPARTPSRATPPREEPAAMPRAATRRPASDVRVEVARVPSSGGVDYTVRVSRPDGAPVSGADVRVRGVMSDGGLVEAPLEPGTEPGVYRGLLTFSPRGPHGLTVRVSRNGELAEIPVAASASD